MRRLRAEQRTDALSRVSEVHERPPTDPYAILTGDNPQTGANLPANDLAGLELLVTQAESHGGGYVPRPMKGDHGRFGYDVIVNGSGFGGTVSALS